MTEHGSALTGAADAAAIALGLRVLADITLPPREGRAATHRWVTDVCDHAYVHALVDDLFDLAAAAEGMADALARIREFAGDPDVGVDPDAYEWIAEAVERAACGALPPSVSVSEEDAMSARQEPPSAADAGVEACPECGETRSSPTWYRHSRCGGGPRLSARSKARRVRRALLAVQLERHAEVLQAGGSHDSAAIARELAAEYRRPSRLSRIRAFFARFAHALGGSQRDTT